MKILFIFSFLISYEHVVVCNSISSCCNVFSNLSQIIDLIQSSTVYTNLKEEMNGSSCVEMTGNNFEISSLIEICEKKIWADYWFLIHDTCKVGPKFKQLLYNNIVNGYPTKVALTNKPSMSIGLYKYDYLLKIGDQLSALKNTDFSDENMQKVKEWAVINEDLVMWDTLPTPNLPIGDHTMRFLRMENWYGGESKRKIEHFNGFDIFKSKSNWYWPTTGDKWVITL